MNLVDVVIVITMLFFIVRGIWRGFFREAGSLAGVILGIWLAALFYPQAADYLKAHLPSFKVQTLQLMGFAAIFLAMLILCNVAGMLLKMLAKKSFLGWADRTLGAGLAVLKGVILTYLAIIVLTFFAPTQTPLIGKSKLAPLVIASYQSMVKVISPATYLNWKSRFLGQGKGADGVAPESVQGPPVKNGYK